MSCFQCNPCCNPCRCPPHTACRPAPSVPGAPATPPTPPPPPPPPTPPTPPAPSDSPYLFAAGIGGDDPYGFIDPVMDIPFGETLSSGGGAVAHSADSPDFTILSPGEYEIDYQLAAYNPGVREDETDLTARLVSSLSGVLDTAEFKKNRALARKKIVVRLSAGEVLSFQLTQSIVSEMSLTSQAVAFRKISD